MGGCPSGVSALRINFFSLSFSLSLSRSLSQETARVNLEVLDAGAKQ